MDTKKEFRIKEILDTDFNFWTKEMTDLGDRIGLIMMICHLKSALQTKKPNVTHKDIIKLCIKDTFIDEETSIKCALICDWFAKDCTKFPNLGIQVKDMPNLIRKQLSELCPF